MVYDSALVSQGWIELRQVDDSDGLLPATSRLVAQFLLPKTTASSEDSIRNLWFHVGESPVWEMQSDSNDGRLPFASNPVNAIQILGIRSSKEEAHLIISNGLFLMTLDLLRQNNPNFSFPCRFEWKEWVWWTSLWDQQLGVLSESVNLIVKV